MASPDAILENVDKHLHEFVKQGPILRDIRRNMEEMRERITTLERKRSAEPGEAEISRKKRKHCFVRKRVQKAKVKVPIQAIYLSMHNP